MTSTQEEGEDTDASAASDRLSSHVIQEIGEISSEEERTRLLGNLSRRRQSLLSFCAPEVREDKCWQAAFQALELTFSQPHPEAARLWISAQRGRKKLFEA